MIFLVAACQPKIKTITVYKKSKITCIAPTKPIFESIESQPDFYSKFAALRRNLVKYRKYLELSEKYIACVEAHLSN